MSDPENKQESEPVVGHHDFTETNPGDPVDIQGAFRQAFANRFGVQGADGQGPLFEEEAVAPPSRLSRALSIAGNLFKRARRAVSGSFEIHIGDFSLKGSLESALQKIVKQVVPTKKRRWPMGFGPIEVPPNATITVSDKPQILFRGEKMINTGDDEGLFIVGIFVGNKPQMTTFSSTIAVKAFNPGIVDNEFMFDVCDPALDITFQIQNTTNQAKKFSMTVIGHAVN